MHDMKGQSLVVGDVVMLPCRVTACYAGSDNFCNVQAVSLVPMPGNGLPVTLSALNTKQVLRANAGDDLTLPAELVGR